MQIAYYNCYYLGALAVMLLMLCSSMSDTAASEHDVNDSQSPEVIQHQHHSSINDGHVP